MQPEDTEESATDKSMNIIFEVKHVSDRKQYSTLAIKSDGTEKEFIVDTGSPVTIKPPDKETKHLAPGYFAPSNTVKYAFWKKERVFSVYFFFIKVSICSHNKFLSAFCQKNLKNEVDRLTKYHFMTK